MSVNEWKIAYEIKSKRRALFHVRLQCVEILAQEQATGRHEGGSYSPLTFGIQSSAPGTDYRLRSVSVLDLVYDLAYTKSQKTTASLRNVCLSLPPHSALTAYSMAPTLSARQLPRASTSSELHVT